MLRPVDALGRISIPKEWMRQVQKPVGSDPREMVFLSYDIETNTITVSEPKDILKCAMCGEKDDEELHFFKQGCICKNCIQEIKQK